jgi:hypothetical protein
MTTPYPISKDVFDDICESIACSSISLRKKCDELQVSTRSFYDYLEVNGDDSKQQYARSKLLQAHLLAAETIEIADEAKDANLARVRVDARKWYCGKVAAKVYGDHLDLTSGGEKLQTPSPSLIVKVIQPN